VDGRIQTVFAVELLFERGRIRIEDEDGITAGWTFPLHSIPQDMRRNCALPKAFTDKPATLMTRVWSNWRITWLTGGRSNPGRGCLPGCRMQARLAQWMEEAGH